MPISTDGSSSTRCDFGSDCYVLLMVAVERIIGGDGGALGCVATRHISF